MFRSPCPLDFFVACGLAALHANASGSMPESVLHRITLELGHVCVRHVLRLRGGDGGSVAWDAEGGRRG